MNPTLKSPTPSPDLAALYAKIPKIECKKLCQDSCGAIRCSDRERREVHIKVGEEIGIGFDGFHCSLLDGARCRVYAIRPLVCRLFGVAEELKCPFGCIPERWLSRDEVLALFQEARIL